MSESAPELGVLIAPNLARQAKREEEGEDPTDSGGGGPDASAHRSQQNRARQHRHERRERHGSGIRRKTVRNCESEDRMLNGLGLTQRAWSGRDGLDPSYLIAARTPRRSLGGVPPSENMPNRFLYAYSDRREVIFSAILW